MGYSYGANFLNTLSDRLQKDGIKVSLSVTIDQAAGGDTKHVDRTVDDNIEQNLNIYQTTPEVLKQGLWSFDTGSFGGPNNAQDPKKTKVDNYNYSGYFDEDEKGKPVEVSHGTIHTVSLGHYVKKIVQVIDKENTTTKKNK